MTNTPQNYSQCSAKPEPSQSRHGHSTHLVVIDALNLIRRIDGALRGFKNQGSLDKEQLIGLTKQALSKLIRGHQPTHIAAVFDGDGNNWRKQLYPEYKANRKPMDPSLAALLPEIIQQWQQLGVMSLTTAHEEADDLIATLSYKVTKHQGRCTVVSTDQGFYQLLPLGVAIWDHFAGHWINQQNIQQKFSISAIQLLDYWAIVGQSGNKIPGVAGMGPKAALTILKQHQDLKTAFSITQGQDKQLLKLQQNKHQAQLSYQLVRLKQNISLGINLQQLRYTAK
ncbi:flap endonuclease Xni [Psychrobium sp. 1_MG-2023]|uniref:flap endonuclease Xni n=1 Tax=Psychrobium sp. 1_MG-2023 TaxID=3062624 RepID=UPI000C34CB21|nr:flap endonuclease Xni [Psychrobium sp. 1_MG-2023]MDP2560929.1 flap endonuclease Xni [Psychrobium sp. 1_MG-2023]PKF56001.1 flap endonuclease Xni [Alteromonadales bacterium alter-6D02]